MEELDLVNKAKQGNKSALNTLLTNNFNVLKGYIIKMTGNKVLSEDIIQESMLKAVLNIHKFKPEYKFSTWIIKISTNVYIDYLRKNKVSEEINDNIDIGSISLEDSVINSLEYEEVMNILLNISYEKRAVFILKHYYGYKYEEIAQIMKCPVGTVRSRLNNAIKQIASEFEERGLI